MIVSSTYFRDHLAEIVSKVADEGEEVILVFGKGKKTKKVVISPTVSKNAKVEKTMPNLTKFLNSTDFKNHKADKKLQNAKDFKEIMKKHYNPEI